MPGSTTIGVKRRLRSSETPTTISLKHRLRSSEMAGYDGLKYAPGIAVTVRTLTVEECANVLADVAARPRSLVVHPFMLRLYYWNNLVAPWMTRWLLRVTGAQR